MTSEFKCTSCHDPHGSSNYRLLKDEVNNTTVGGYLAGDVPNAWVLSNEEGFPTGGFRKGSVGADDVAHYVPNYTSPQYAKNADRAMSAWCSACHKNYNVSDGVAGNPTGETSYGTFESVVIGGVVTPVGGKVRHRHQVDIPLTVGLGADRGLNVEVLDDGGLPLEMGITLLADGADYHSAKIWDESGNISCLTCHFAHGSPATMEGWAVAELVGTTANPTPRKITPATDTNTIATQSNPMGVNPNFSQALLRYPNRGVCERCHNK
jgi:predicted CXXCH cytochrome family protein